MRHSLHKYADVVGNINWLKFIVFYWFIDFIFLYFILWELAGCWHVNLSTYLDFCIACYDLVLDHVDELYNRPYSSRGHDGQKERLGLQIYRKFARPYVNCDVTSLLLHVPVT